MSSYMLFQGILGHLKAHIPLKMWNMWRLKTFKKWLNCWGWLWSAAQSPAGCQSLLVHPRGLYWVHSLMGDGTEHSQRATQRDLRSWINGPRWISWSSAKGSAMSYTLGGAPCAPVQAEGVTSRTAALQRMIPSCPWATVCPCGKGALQPPGLH